MSKNVLTKAELEEYDTAMEEISASLRKELKLKNLDPEYVKMWMEYNAGEEYSTLRLVYYYTKRLLSVTASTALHYFIVRF